MAQKEMTDREAQEYIAHLHYHLGAIGAMAYSIMNTPKLKEVAERTRLFESMEKIHCIDLKKVGEQAAMNFEMLTKCIDQVSQKKEH